MAGREWLELLLFFLVLLICTPLLGHYMARVFTGKKTVVHSLLDWLEKGSYKVAGIHPDKEMDWQQYLKALFFFNLCGFFAVFILQQLQPWLPLNPQGFSEISWSLAFNISVSFVTNTNWQSYAGESTLSYLTQMAGLTVQNFTSAATGNAVLLALIRGITRKECATIGNFWTDLVRTIIYLLLPLSILLASALLTQGVIQNFSPYVEVTTLENNQQIIPLGPVASQVAIKQLGTNGGGFFQANSAHPFENPTALTNFLENIAILLIPAALIYMYGVLIGEKKEGWLLLLLVSVFWLGGVAIAFYAEQQANPILDAYPLMEGKETRFGIGKSIFWAISTTTATSGSVNAMLSCLSPLAGGLALFNIMLGGLIFGGVGVGLCTMLMFILLTVFLSGLMVGRTPEYKGKKIEKREMQWTMVAILLPSSVILMGAGVSLLLPTAFSSLGNHGPHGLTEILYAFSSAAENNGSAFAGLKTSSTYYRLILGVVMVVGRMAVILPSLAIAGLLAKKKITPFSAGTFSTSSGLFIILLGSVILIVGALTFFPVLALGPIAEQLLMQEGRTF